MSKLNIIQRRAANSAIADDEDKFLEDLRGRLWANGGAVDGKWKSLAERANVSPRTISRFASGDTKKPQILTIRRMFGALSYAMEIKKIHK